MPSRVHRSVRLTAEMTNQNKNEFFWLKASVDPNGRLFSLNDSLFRTMRTFDQTYYQRLLKNISANPILDSHMARTTISTEGINGLDFVLKHETIHPTIYPFEWSSLMFKDAALCHCDVHIELAKSGFNLQDAHPWNVLFRNTTPVFVDYGSVIKENLLSRRLALLKEYTSYMIYPLYLMSELESAKARRYLTHSDPPLDLRDLLGYFSFRDALNNIVKTTSSRIHSCNNLVTMLIAIRKHIDSLSLQSSSPRNECHDDEFQCNETRWQDKQRNIREILNRLNPATVLDIGCATGRYAVMAAKLGSKVIAMDVDDGIINHIYKRAAATNLPITPVVKDLFAEEYVNGRYRGEMVLALDIVDHLALTQGYSFDQIAKTLSNYTEKWLATEFIDRRDSFVKEYLQNNGGSYQGDTSWFKCENFISSLSRYFLIKQKFKSSSDNSSLLLAEKI